MTNLLSSNKPTILIIARPGRFRDSLTVLAGSIFGTEAIRIANDVYTGLNKTFSHPPAAVLLSLEKGEESQGALTDLKKAWPATRTILLVENERESQSMELALADVILMKGTRAGKLLQYLEEVLSG